MRARARMAVLARLRHKLALQGRNVLEFLTELLRVDPARAASTLSASNPTTVRRHVPPEVVSGLRID